MLAIDRLVRHLSVGVAAFLLLAAAPLARQAPDITGSATFYVLVGGTRVGTETATVSRRGTGWLLSSTGILAPPLDLTTNTFEVAYTADWRAERLTIDVALRGQPQLLRTTFGATSATSDLTLGSRHSTNTQPISGQPFVLANNIFSSYESLALRAASLPMETPVPVFVAPTGQTTVTLHDVTPRRVSTGSTTLDLQAYRLTIAGAEVSVLAEVWVDTRGRLARLALPASQLVLIRNDLAGVIAREERAVNPGDDDALIGSNGFSLSATVTRPVTAAAPYPAVVLVAGPGPHDRDHTVFGISVMSQFAGALSRAGYLTVRYDARGIGSSGGRAETSRLDEYADDVISVVAWLRKRKDVDRTRIAVVGYGDTGPIALTAAARSGNVRGVVLLGAPAGTGREITLAQQRRVLEPLPLSVSEKSARIALQTRIIEAALSGKGWEQLPDDVRAQANTLWFQSWLRFDPAQTLKKVKQPVLIVHGALDAEVPASDAERNEALASVRGGLPPSATNKVVLPGVNHLLTPAVTGSVDEYPTLATRTIAPGVGDAVANWVKGLR